MLDTVSFRSLLSETGILRDAFRIINKPDDLGFFFCGAVMPPEIEAALAESGQRLSACGTSLDPHKAMGAALGEALERFAFASWEPASRDSALRDYTDDWASLPFQFPGEWTREKCLEELQEQSPYWCYSPDHGSRSDGFSMPVGLISCVDGGRWQPTTSGMAAGQDWDQAASKAMFEIVERSTVMTAWHASIHGVAVDPRLVLPTDWQSVLDRFRGSLELRLFVSDIHLPVVVASLLLGVPAVGETRLALGSACRCTIEEASRAAVAEAALGFHSLGGSRTASPSVDEPSNFAEHMLRYQNSASDVVLDWLVPSDSEGHLASNDRFGADGIAGLINRAGYTVTLIDMTPNSVRRYGLRVARAVVPGLIPMLVGRSMPLGGKFGDAASRFAVGRRVGGEPEWRDDPHPFP